MIKPIFHEILIQINYKFKIQTVFQYFSSKFLGSEVLGKVMHSKTSIVLFSSICLTIGTTLLFIGIRGVRQMKEENNCREVCRFAGIGFAAEGLTDRLVLVIIIVSSIVHFIGGLSAMNLSYVGLTVFVSAYGLRFLILFNQMAIKALTTSSKYNWKTYKELLLMIDSKQTKVLNDFRLILTIGQLFLFFWSLLLIRKFLELSQRRRLKNITLNMILESWLSNNKKGFHY